MEMGMVKADPEMVWKENQMKKRVRDGDRCRERVRARERKIERKV